MKNIFASIFMLMSFAVVARASLTSSAASGSCSESHPRFGYFYAYTYQYASVQNDTISTESHSFSFSGALSGMEHAQIIGVNGRHIIYLGHRYEMAVPFVQGAGFFVRQRDFVGGPDRSKSQWIKLCSY